MLAILDDAYGRPPERPHGDAISELVLALLSQHSSDHNSGRAFHRLIERFPEWDAVIEAPTSEVEEAIRPGGLAPTKAPRLQALLAEVRGRVPDFDIDFLETMPLDDEQMLAFHVDLIQHGRRTCHARNPECERCPLLAHCPQVGL